MEDISIFLKPVATEVAALNQLSGQLKIHTADSFPTMKSGGVAIIGLSEYRKSEFDTGDFTINAVRKYLYKLRAGNTWKKNIYDLGDILSGSTYKDTELAIIKCMVALGKMQIVPVFVGGSQDLVFSIYKSFKELEQTVNVVIADSHLDIGDVSDDVRTDCYIHKLITHQPSFLFNVCNIGYQSYFVKQEDIDLYDKLYFDYVRLGYLSQDISKAEPHLRNADIFSFDADAIRYADFKNARKSPNGFYGEHACALMRYAGISDKLSVAAIQNIQFTENEDSHEAHLFAQMLWFFIDGYCARYGDYPMGSKKSYTKYTVVVSDFKDKINFYKSDKSDRWWMEVPYPIKSSKKFARHYMVPCNYEDYQMALKDEIPDLWWKTFQKLI